MSLESRLTNALHQTDGYQPSPDLFARVARSIEEDRKHRRRTRLATVAVIVSLGVIVAFLVAVSDRDSDGVLGWPKWSLQMVVLAILGAVLISLGPAIGRYGQPLLADVFHLGPATGERFARLLDIAYYVGFGGAILLSLDLTAPGEVVVITSEGLSEPLSQVAVVLLMLGLSHTGNLLLIPVVGLLYSSLVRRTARHAAGAAAPPVSRAARNADRVAMALVLTVVLVGITAVLVGLLLGIRGVG
jgi:hypothetical protein